MLNYPPFDPSYKRVLKLGGYDRTCLVVELLSLKELSKAELAVILECIEAGLAKHKAMLESSRVIPPSSFSHELLDALRL